MGHQIFHWLKYSHENPEMWHMSDTSQFFKNLLDEIDVFEIKPYSGKPLKCCFYKYGQANGS